MDNSDLGNRMKRYESVTQIRLSPRTPVILRLDGRAFHSYCRGFKKPVDEDFQEAMWETALALCEDVSGSQLAYVQSDEITILVQDYKDLNTQPWFDYDLQKITTAPASLASVTLHTILSARFAKNQREMPKRLPTFDCRAFNVPKEDVVNSIIWRQQDATRNSISSLAQAHFSHKQLHKKSCKEMQEMLFQEKGINWDACPISQKRGICIIKDAISYSPIDFSVSRRAWRIDKEIPIFTQDRNYIQRFVDSPA